MNTDSHEMEDSSANSQYASLAGRLASLVAIHDALPHEDEAPGLTVSEIQKLLKGFGLHLPRHTVNRYLKDAADLFWIYEEGSCGRAVLWKRVHEENLCARIRPLAEKVQSFYGKVGEDQWVRMGADNADACPDFPSGIHLDSIRP